MNEFRSKLLAVCLCFAIGNCVPVALIVWEATFPDKVSPEGPWTEDGDRMNPNISRDRVIVVAGLALTMTAPFLGPKEMGSVLVRILLAAFVSVPSYLLAIIFAGIIAICMSGSGLAGVP